MKFNFPVLILNQVRHYNKKEKTANLLFKVVEYGLIVFLVNALLPNSPITSKTMWCGGVVVAVLFVLALWITPEKEDTQ
ncbi:MAG: hypothetical protein CVV37_06525 [Nitrospira bacterium HGW-Nitrospira-1]|nr:MAG: hypothetical protein CVV37_06525 [Nitrospira bacterium HGW-Nitrospira-1]